VVQAKWRTEVRRYEGHVKCAQLKLAVTTARSTSEAWNGSGAAVFYE